MVGGDPGGGGRGGEETPPTGDPGGGRGGGGWRGGEETPPHTPVGIQGEMGGEVEKKLPPTGDPGGGGRGGVDPTKWTWTCTWRLPDDLRMGTQEGTWRKGGGTGTRCPSRDPHGSEPSTIGNDRDRTNEGTQDERLEGKAPCADLFQTQYDASMGIYPPSEDTFLLVDASWEHRKEWMRKERAAVVVEVGSGSGYVLASIHAMTERIGAKTPVLVACDVGRNACEATVETANQHGCEERMLVVQDDLARGFRRRMKEGFAADLLLCNPPYVPTEEEEADRDDIARAWAGGRRGRRVIDRFVEHAGNMLDENGIALLVALQENDPEDVCEAFRGFEMDATVVKTIAADEEKLYVIMARKKIQGKGATPPPVPLDAPE